jgi:hypothetical protein
VDGLDQGGVILAFASYLVVGSWLLITVFHKLHDIFWRILAVQEHIGLATASMFILAVAFFVK